MRSQTAQASLEQHFDLLPLFLNWALSSSSSLSPCPLPCLVFLLQALQQTKKTLSQVPWSAVTHAFRLMLCKTRMTLHIALCVNHRGAGACCASHDDFPASFADDTRPLNARGCTCGDRSTAFGCRSFAWFTF